MPASLHLALLMSLHAKHPHTANALQLVFIIPVRPRFVKHSEKNNKKFPSDSIINVTVEPLFVSVLTKLPFHAYNKYI